MSTEFILYTVIIHNGFDMVLSLVRETKTAETETRPRLSKIFRDETLGTSRDRLETETSRPRPHPWSTVLNAEDKFQIFIHRII